MYEIFLPHLDHSSISSANFLKTSFLVFRLMVQLKEKKKGRYYYFWNRRAETDLNWSCRDRVTVQSYNVVLSPPDSINKWTFDITRGNKETGRTITRMKPPPMIVSIFHIAHEVFEVFKLKIIQKPIRNFKTDKKYQSIKTKLPVLFLEIN